MTSGIKLSINDVNKKDIEAGFKIFNPPEPYINNHTTRKYRCPLCNKIFETQPSKIWNKHTKSCGCYQRQVASKNIKDSSVRFKMSQSTKIPKNGNSLGEKYPESLKLWDYEKNYPKTPYNVNYGTADKYWFKCEYHNHSYLFSCCKLTINNRCHYCSGHKVLIGFNDLLFLQPQICEEWDYSKNILKPNQVTIGSNKKVWWKCKKCNFEWKTSVNKRTSGKSCPKCNESKLEKETSRILDNLKIKYNRWYKPGLLGTGGGLLEIDFYLPKQNIWIECQGEQHYIENHWYDKESQIKTITHDKIKRQYCKDNNIFLIEIPHTHFDKIEEILRQKLNFC